ncbi:transglycosylase SLT domain-containing protein [Catenuloplanes atrovinosus]|uniref:Soluble lytic murein transglycosylase-like protein n=1 Tax=Catenuloplanes atrovinosus TaxID=137266 RepID=A0AAE4CEX7_9ACTN|nr:transglycosylase SLT domain-containing protein [Catenuloplanes atrovinosus]MDR7280484.1 soluble lytic murein transglycosylase-like protein [Catenuloplanes atrovinosus]
MIQGIANVQQRIQQLQTQLGLNPTVTNPVVVSTSGATATGGTSFASALTAAAGPAPATGGATGAGVVDAAKKYLGVPYVFGSTNPDKGLDCSSLVQRAYADLGVKLPRIAADQAKAGTAVPSLDQARPGDILAFNRPVDHVGIYLGDNKMIAAPKPGDHVKIQKVYETPSTIRRVLDAPVAAAPSAASVAGLRAAALGTSPSLSGVPYADLFTQAAAKHGVPAKLLAAVAKVESSYNPRAVSPAGAQGLMQLMPSTARGLGVDNAFDPKQAIEGAAKLLKSNLKEFKSLDLALAAYNAGGGAVKKYDGIPPFAETRAYVPKVKAALAALG